MKKSLLAVGLSVALFSCQKTPTAPTLASNGIQGTSIFTGTITKSQANGGPNVAFPSVTVTVSIPNNQLYPQSNGGNYNTIGNSVFSGVTDANGNFSISVSTTSKAINAWYRITPPASVYNSLTGTQALFNTSAGRLSFQSGSPTQLGTVNLSENTILNTTTGATGIATLMGIVYIQYWTQTGPTTYVLNNYPLANATVNLDFNADPSTGNIKTYTVTTDSRGTYIMGITTSNGGGFLDQGRLYTYSFTHTQDTIKTGGTQVTGLQGYYTGYNITAPYAYINGLTPNAIINEEYIYYDNFHAN